MKIINFNVCLKVFKTDINATCTFNFVISATNYSTAKQHALEHLSKDCILISQEIRPLAFGFSDYVRMNGVVTLTKQWISNGVLIINNRYAYFDNPDSYEREDANKARRIDEFMSSVHDSTLTSAAKTSYSNHLFSFQSGIKHVTRYERVPKSIINQIESAARTPIDWYFSGTQPLSITAWRYESLFAAIIVSNRVNQNV